MVGFLKGFRSNNPSNGFHNQVFCRVCVSIKMTGTQNRVFWRTVPFFTLCFHKTDSLTQNLRRIKRKDMTAYIIVLVSLATSPGNTCLDCNRRYPKRPNKGRSHQITEYCHIPLHTLSNIQNRAHKIVSPCRGRKRPNKENKDAILFGWVEGDILLRKRTCSWCFLFVLDIVSKRPPLETDIKWKVEWTGQNSLNVCRPVKTGRTKIIIR